VIAAEPVTLAGFTVFIPNIAPAQRRVFLYTRKECSMSSRVEQLKELNTMLAQDLINKDEFDSLRRELMTTDNASVMSRVIPKEPALNSITFRHPTTGEIFTVNKTTTFWLALAFGIFYFGYKGAWLHAAVGAVLGFLTYGISWVAYAFFAYRIIVDTYRRNGWVEV
jgi:hypothetical protein